MSVGIYSKRLNTEPLIDRNKLIVEASNVLSGKMMDLTPVAPMAVCELCIAQMHHQAGNGQNVRSRTLFHATPIGIGWVLSLVARIIRVVVRSLGIVLSVPVAAFQQNRYGSMTTPEGRKILNYNVVAEDLRRIGYEWVDLGITLFAVPLIGTINTFSPLAISTKGIYEYYEGRIKDVTAKNAQWVAARHAYHTQEKQIQQAWKAAQKGSE